MNRACHSDRPMPSGRRRLATAALLTLIVACWIPPLQAAGDNVRVWSTGQPLDVSYRVIHRQLEADHFYVVFEPDIQANLSRFAKRWGANYNRNHLQGIRAMVFCNGWYANQVGNADPEMLALCPLHLTLIETDDDTRVLFLRPGRSAAGSPAQPVAEALEAEVVKAVDAAVAQLRAKRKPLAPDPQP